MYVCPRFRILFLPPPSCRLSQVPIGLQGIYIHYITFAMLYHTLFVFLQSTSSSYVTSVTASDLFVPTDPISVCTLPPFSLSLSLSCHERLKSRHHPRNKIRSTLNHPAALEDSAIKNFPALYLEPRREFVRQ